MIFFRPRVTLDFDTPALQIVKPDVAGKLCSTTSEGLTTNIDKTNT